jgi:uncharacterized protein YegP (UPF0339 family)
MWRYTIEKDREGKPRWFLHAPNGKRIAVSGQAFDSTYDARQAADSFRSGASTWTYDVYAEDHGSFRWRATSNDGATVADSSDSFSEHADAQRSADDVQANAPEAAGL